MSTRDEIQHHLATQGALAVREHPSWTRMLSRMAAEGQLFRWLPGVYVAARVADDLRVRCAAIMLWDPDAVITGRAAAHLSFWPELRVDDIEVHSRRKKVAPRGIRLHRSRVPQRDIVTFRGLRLARAAWTAVHLAASDLGDAIDTALRAGAAKVDSIAAAMTRSARRWGNKARRPVVDASRDNPWSRAERVLHQILRGAGITGWTGNLECRLHDGKVFLDVGFASLRIAIEVDGKGVHEEAGAFERDREKQNALYAEGGWVVLRFTWRMLQKRDAVLGTIMAALRRRRRELKRGVPR